MSKFHRRDFLKGSAVALGSLCALETLSGCRPSEPSQGGGGGGTPDETPKDVHQDYPMAFTELAIPTTCWIGKQDCGAIARVIQQEIGGKTVQRLVKLEGNPNHPRNNGRLCVKGMAQVQAVYDYNRVKWPLKRINPKGRQGRFKRITWEEALGEVAAELQEAKASGKKVLWQKGRSKAEDFYDHAFVSALAAWGSNVAKVGHGAYCSDAGYRAGEYTIGYHGVLSPDFEHCEYLLAWGWGLTTSGGNKLCQITWPQKFLAARESGVLKRVVCLDPSRRQTGPHADDWLANRPGSDLAFFLGLAHYLVHNTDTGYDNGLVDEGYLLGHTNAPYLLQDDGTFYRVGGKEQVWDPRANGGAGGPVDFDTAGVTPPLLGTFTIDDGQGNTIDLKTAFQAYKDHLAQYTPEWADATCDLPAGSVARVARELFDHAHIGEFIDIDGTQVPYRPVGIMAYHVTQQELGFVAARAAINVFQLLGAIYTAGGMQIDFAPGGLHKNWKKLNEVSIQTSDLDFRLGGSKFFPISSGAPSFFLRAKIDPERYDVDTSTLPKKVIVHMTDPLGSYTDRPTIRQAYAKFEHVTVVAPWLSNIANYYADIVLPAATIEKYEGPMSAKTPDEKATALRVPPITPLWESKGDISIYLDLCEKAGLLTEYITEINKVLGLEGTSNALDTSRKPTEREIFDAWAKEAGHGGVTFFEENGVTDTTRFDPAAKYKALPQGSDGPYHGAIHRLYGESLLRYRSEMMAAGVDEVYYQDYTAFPTWREPTMWKSVRAGYPLHLVSYKFIENKQSRSSFIPFIAEILKEQKLLMNPMMAEELGLADGDAVYVESHNALTGETRLVKTKVSLRQTIRPDTVAMSHHFGLDVTPDAGTQGPSPNELFFAGEGYIQCTMDASFQVMVRVFKA